jgi:energy-coupling factor transport system ATP-binding protein
MAMLPDVLVLDEPDSQLDPLGVHELFSVIRELSMRHHMTILLTSHKSEEIAEFVNRIVVLNEGEIILEGEPHKVFEEADLLEKVGVKVPQVTELSLRLRDRLKDKTIRSKEIPITLDEGYLLLSEMLDKRILAVEGGTEKTVAQTREKDIPIIELRDVSFTYPGPAPVQALKNISVKIYPGEFLGIIGQNGCGKTTLAKLILGLIRATSGRILLRGKDTAEMTVPEIASKVGLALQNPDHQLFKLTVEDEVAFGPTNLGLPDHEVKTRVNEALEQMGLASLRDKYPPSLSFGDRREVTIAAVLAMKPEVIIFDEPTTGQDWKGKHKIMNIAKRLGQLGLTIIMITHDMNLIAEYAERTIVLGMGELRMDGPTADVFGRVDVLKEIYLNPPQIAVLSQRLERYGLRGNDLTVDQFCDRLRLGYEQRL